jgi:hypothetical protein
MDSGFVHETGGESDAIMIKIHDMSRLVPNIIAGVAVYIGYMF